MPLSLSIVIPSQRRVDLLRRCLASVTRHTPPRSEILVVDDGSPQAIVSAVAHQFSEVRLLRRERSGGFCTAVNAGIRSTSGDIVELLNDDTEVEPGWTDAALACFEDPQIAAVAPLVLLGDGEHVDSAGDRYYLGGIAGKRGHGQSLTAEYLQSCEVFGASASSAFYRRSMLEKAGGFPDEFGAYFEDIDVAFRLRRAGGRIWFEPASRVRHHLSSTYGSKSSRRLLEQQSLNEERVFWRNLPLSALPQHLAVLAGKAWLRWQQGNLTPFVLGRARLLAELGTILRHRKWLRSLGALDWEQWHVERQFCSAATRERSAPLARRGY